MRNLFRCAGFTRAIPLVTVVCALSLAPLTVTAASSADQPVRLRGSSAIGLRSGDRVGSLDPSATIDIQLALQLRDRPALDQLIASVSSPGSAEYGHFLTPAEFDARFGPTAAQVSQATGFLAAHGLAVTASAPGGTTVDARGSVGAVEEAFSTSLGSYRDSTGRTFFANDSDPALPAGLASFVAGVQGLNNRYQRHHAAVLPRTCPPTCASTPYSPAQLRQAYQLSAAPLTTLTGAGQSLGLLELDDFWQGHLDGFTSAYGLPAITPSRQIVDGGPALGSGQVEVELDIEVMHEIAPSASIQVFEAPNNTDAQLIDVYGCMVNPGANAGCPNHASGQISSSNSTSWGLCEPDQAPATTITLSNIFSQAASQGQSFFAASGDSGAADCLISSGSTALAVDNPASDPHVTGVGGTRLLLNPDNTYNNETAWPASPPKHPNWGSGGGKSIVYARPSWQSGPGVITSVGAPRQVPDVALDADPVTGYSIYTCSSVAAPCTTSGAGLTSIGGTSAGAPAWAAYSSIYNEYAACQGQPKLGFANTRLYPLGVTPPTLTPSNDVTTGDNFAGQTTGYSAGPGYDMVTGLGTLRASDLARDLAGSATSAVQVSFVSPAVGGSGSTVHVTGCGFATSAGQVPSVVFGSHSSQSVTYLDSNNLSATAPFNFNGTVSVTVTNPAGAGGGTSTLANAFTYSQPPAPPPPAGGTNLYAALVNGGSSGEVEVHALAQSSNYSQFIVHAATALGSVSTPADWQFLVAPLGGDGQADLFAIHLRNTQSGQVEVHVLAATSSYQSFMLHAATPLAAVPAGRFEFALGSLAGDHRSNLYAIALNGTSSGMVEVHALSETSNYGGWAVHAATPLLAVADPSTWQFKIGDKAGSGDLIAIPHASTGSGMTEVHILTRASGYQGFALHVATPLGYTADSQYALILGDHDNDGIPDLYAVKMNGTGSGQTEVHILSGASQYTGWIEHAPAALGPTSPSSWQFSTH